MANIRGTGTDVTGRKRRYAGGHYVAIVGYANNGNHVLIADPSSREKGGIYWMTLHNLTDWIANKGYTALR